MWSHPFDRKCKHCGTKLRPNNKIKQFLIIELFTAFLLFKLINENIGVISLKGGALFVLSTAIMCYPFEKFAWRKGYYTIK